MGNIWLWMGIGVFGVLSVVSFTANKQSPKSATSTRNKKHGWCSQREFY